MKILLSSIAALTLASTSAYAMDCKFGQTQYYMDWTSFAMKDADPSGRPTRAYAFPVKSGYLPADPTIVHFEYGMARRFQFDSPEVVDIEGQKGGAMIIAQNLLQPYEATVTKLYFQSPVSNLKIELHDIDDNAQFGRAFRDRIGMIGRNNLGQVQIPEVDIINTSSHVAKPLLAYEADRGFSGDNIYPIGIQSMTGRGFASYGVSFDGAVKDVALHFSSIEGPGSSYAASSNPSPQEIRVGRVTFCKKD